MAEEINSLLQEFREELDYFKKARILHTLRTKHRVPLVTLSKELNIKASYLSHYLRLLRLPPMVIDGFYSKSITLTHLFILSRLPSPSVMQEVYEQILTQSLTTYELEQIVREKLYNTKGEGTRIPQEQLKSFIDFMSSQGIDIQIAQTRIRSTVTIKIKGALEVSSKKLTKIITLLRTLTTEE